MFFAGKGPAQRLVTQIWLETIRGVSCRKCFETHSLRIRDKQLSHRCLRKILGVGLAERCRILGRMFQGFLG